MKDDMVTVPLYLGSLVDIAKVSKSVKLVGVYITVAINNIGILPVNRVDAMSSIGCGDTVTHGNVTPLCAVYSTIADTSHTSATSSDHG